MQTTGSLYVHIPFCTKKCGYCHFFVVRDQEHAPFIEALQKEWQYYKLDNLCSVYFGGGTPSLLESFEELLATFSPPSSAEITVEANPERLTKEQLKRYRQEGINRLSIGVQSFDDRMLGTLTRTHDAQKAQESILMAHEAGFENISIDLMFDLPGQTLDSWERSLNIACSLPITHLSLYNLTIEPGTLFFKQKKKAQDDDPRFLEMAVAKLEAAGLSRYEISAFGKRAVHNSGYWTGRPFIGLGPSAFSYWEGRRFRNICHYKSYLTRINQGLSVVDFEETLPPEKAARELFAINLRLLEGTKIVPAIDTNALEAQGLLERRGEMIRLTPLGRLHYNTVAMEIV